MLDHRKGHLQGIDRWVDWKIRRRHAIQGRQAQARKKDELGDILAFFPAIPEIVEPAIISIFRFLKGF